MNYALFQKQLEADLRIYSWDPSSEQLAEIAREIARLQPMDKAGARAIVAGICPALLLTTEGEDMSDLRTLVALALAAAAKG